MLVLREAVTEDDYCGARELFVEYVSSLGIDLSFQCFDDEVESLPGAYVPPSGSILLAEFEGQLAGCVAMRPLAGGACEMKRLYVRAAFRGKGVARALAEAIVEAARARGYSCMLLDTIASMEAARSLYLSLGFEETAPYRHNPLDGALFFKLDLGPRT